VLSLVLTFVSDSRVTACYHPPEIPFACPDERDAIEESPIGTVIITVKDSGPGLSPEQQQALFHQGVQFNPNELQAGQGSGLGLWISKEIVSLHHGTILVTSDGLGTGSVFKVTLPVVLRESLGSCLGTLTALPLSCASGEQKSLLGDSLFPIPEPGPRPESPPKQEPESPPESQREPERESRPRHVLVVDDAASNRKLVCRLLRSKGFVCHEAENGAECVEKVMSREHPYDLILMDFEMPVMNGPSAARRLRENRCDLLIVGVTGNVLPEDQSYFLEHGANVVLRKPLIVSDLLEEIERHQRSPLSVV
jgi:CheY-like chemotaxis protein